MTRGVLLVNLGTPDSTSVADVRRYLGEFLMDPRVINVPRPIRRLIVSGFILPTRPKRSAHAYAQIWDAAGPDTGSPLLYYSEQLRQALKKQSNQPCALAMRYGEPSIAAAIAALKSSGVDQLLLVALYPHYADSTIGTTVAAVEQAIDGLPGRRMELQVLPPFYADPNYIDAQATLIAEHLPAQWDHLLLSYHGLPENHLTKADPTGKHCLQREDCCQIPSPAHASCYRHQVMMTTQLLAGQLGISADRYSLSFQSRLGRLPWLTPYTDETLAALPGRGVKRLVVACPAFVADNLETLEEIGISGRQIFLSAGGESFTLVPCLNSDERWVTALAGLCRDV